jgi:hypothetical protein
MSDQTLLTDVPPETKPAIKTAEPPDLSKERPPYLYQAAGIEEREGYIPVWLTLVVVSLILWSVYYTIRYWSPD